MWDNLLIINEDYLYESYRIIIRLSIESLSLFLYGVLFRI